MSLFDYHSPLDYARDERLERECAPTPIPRAPAERGISITRPLPADPLQSRILLRDRTPPRNTPVNRKQGGDGTVDPERTPHPPRQPRQRLNRALDIPKPSRRSKRTQEPEVAIDLRLRPEERQLLTEVGKFRVISKDDLARFIYNGNASHFNQDLRFLKENGLVQVHLLNARRDGRNEDRVRRFEAVTLTWYGRQMVERDDDLPKSQQLYSGLVKVKEVEHDAQIYRAYVKELAGIERLGGRNVRVKLDFELKAEVQRGVYLARKAQPKQDLSEIKAEVAQELQLPVINNKVVIPDARLEYELPSGDSAHVDIEVATSAYRRSHLAGKSQAGFHLYISKGDIGRLGPAVQDDHNIMSAILEF